MLKLETKAVEFDGESYEICCNMAALEELEALHGGSMKAVFECDANHISAELLLIMLNEARADRGEDPITKAHFSRRYNYAMLREMDIFGMFMRAMSPEAANNDAGDKEKN